ncbi:hypothetical protein BCR41DRAFT_289343, partial [Lobosporangium transversale]
QRCDDISSYERFDWAIPVIELFHLQMMLATTILRTHYGDIGVPGSLAFYASMLGRNRVTLDGPDFYATNELLQHTFDAMVIRAWGLDLGCDCVQGMLDYILQEKLEQRIDIVLDKLMELSELEQLNGTVSMNAALFIRDMLIYIELSSAIKAGDTGRIHEMLVWVTIFCQVGGTKNYAYELLRLQRGLKCAWTDQ